MQSLHFSHLQNFTPLSMQLTFAPSEMLMIFPRVFWHCITSIQNHRLHNGDVKVISLSSGDGSSTFDALSSGSDSCKMEIYLSVPNSQLFSCVVDVGCEQPVEVSATSFKLTLSGWSIQFFSLFPWTVIS